MGNIYSNVATIVLDNSSCYKDIHLDGGGNIVEFQVLPRVMYDYEVPK